MSQGVPRTQTGFGQGWAPRTQTGYGPTDPSSGVILRQVRPTSSCAGRATAPRCAPSPKAAKREAARRGAANREAAEARSCCGTQRSSEIWPTARLASARSCCGTRRSIGRQLMRCGASPARIPRGACRSWLALARRHHHARSVCVCVCVRLPTDSSVAMERLSPAFRRGSVLNGRARAPTVVSALKAHC